MDWWSVDAGGVQVATGGDWELSGTAGQADASAAHVSNGGPWQLTGGYWAVTAADTGYLFASGFEN